MLAHIPSHEPSSGALVDPVKESIDTVSDFHLEHVRDASWMQRLIDSFTRSLGRPHFVIILVALIIAWTAINGALAMRGSNPVDGPPYHWLDLAATLVALIVALLILATQQRADLLAERRAQLMLELALMSDKKTAKLIALLEELRKDHPSVADRLDLESDGLAVPVDPKTVLAEIDERAHEHNVSS